MGADLHVHTSFSDGSLTPRELVAAARKSNLTTIAITDHDTVAGIKEGIEAARECGLEVIPGIEFSAYVRDRAEIHLLGYFIDYNHSILLDRIEKIYDLRKQRARKMISLLQEKGIELSYEKIKKMAGSGYIGRPHLARALVKEGYIKKIADAFTDEFIGNGSRAYISKFKMKPAAAIELVRMAGGIPVLAHPGHSNNGAPFRKEFIAQLQKNGLRGIEVFHSRHNAEQVTYYRRCARELQLLITGGSDFHGENSPHVQLGDVVLEEYYLEKLKAAPR